MDDVLKKKNGNESEGRYLSFSIDQKKFAIPLLHVKEVIGNAETTSIPQTPSYFKGIINLRGQVISVIDLRMKFNLGKAQVSPEAAIIILDFESISIGVIVDSVDCVSAYHAKDISNPPDLDSKIDAAFITGIARSGQELTLILDLKVALNAEDYKTVKDQQLLNAENKVA